MSAAELSLNPLTMIQPITIVLIVLIFIATYFALRRVFIFPYLAVIEERERLFDEADSALSQADEHDREAREEAGRLLDKAASDVEQSRLECKGRCDNYQRQRVGEAMASASAILEKGRATIFAERAEQRERLRGQVTDCVGIACQRLLGRAEPQVVDEAVDRAMARRKG
jgi:F0F1-type ATP synthase membrane subunit b/b'